MRAEGSIAIEEGRGRMDVRFKAVEVRRGSRVDEADMVGWLLCCVVGGGLEGRRGETRCELAASPGHVVGPSSCRLNGSALVRCVSL